MPNKAHRHSQELSSKAELLAREGRVEKARELYLQAASLEAEALAQVGADKPRTRGILAVSLASQYYKAAAYDEAVNVATTYMTDASVPAFAREQLKILLEKIEEE